VTEEGPPGKDFPAESRNA